MSDGKKKKNVDVEKILKTNPRVDPNQLAEGLIVLQKLRASGLAQRPGYNIDSPYSRPLQRVTKSDK